MNIKTNQSIKVFILFMATIAVAEVPWQTDISKADEIVIKLVILGPGDEMLSRFGHCGIIINDTTHKVSRIYNFGIVEDEPTFFLKFLLHRLTYFVDVSTDTFYLKQNTDFNRDILIQTLNIPQTKRLALAYSLAIKSLPENRNITYDNYFNNCSTKIRDIIDHIVDGKLYEITNKQANMTLRSHTTRYIHQLPVIELLLMYFLNDSIDKPIRRWDEMFLPNKLANYLESLYYLDKNGEYIKFVKDQYIYYQSDRVPVPEHAPKTWIRALIVGIILGSIAVLITYLSNYKDINVFNPFYGVYTTFLGIIIGLPSILLTLIILFTDYDITYYNENLIFVNPLFCLFIFIGIRIYQNKNKFRKWLLWIWNLHLGLLIFAAGLKIFPPFDQDNKLIFAFVTPIYLLNTVSLWRFERKRKNNLLRYKMPKN